MNFSPFAFQNQGVTAPPSPLPSGLVVNLWQGDYTAGSTTWTNSAPGSTATVSAIPSGGYTKNATGLVFSGSTRQTLFQINSDGVWDSNAAWTVVINMHITSTSNRNLWGKQSVSSNGMGILFTNNPFYLMRAPGSSQQVTTTATTLRGARYVYTMATNGGIGLAVNLSAQYYVNKTKPTMSIANNASTNLAFNNTRNFTFGNCQSFTDPQINGFLNRLLIFNKQLSDAEVNQVVDYCDANL
jgi:hypothetical protein